MIDIKEVLLLWFIIFFDKTSAVSGVTTIANKAAIKNQITQNLQLAEKLYKPIIKKF